MPLDDAAIRSRVEQYLDLVATGTADQVLAMFAPDATVEDPVGSEVKRGRDEIHAFYASFEAMTKRTELVLLRTCAGEAAFHFQIATEVSADLTATMAPVEVMTFDDEGLITSMRAWWGESDLTLA